MEVSSGSFPSEAIKIIENIADSHFLAVDFEFSGVAGRRAGGGVGRLSMQEYYSDLRSAAQIYQILQIGLTVVTEDIDNGSDVLKDALGSIKLTLPGRYEVRPYNINLSPLPACKESAFTRVWSYNSGATSFLIRNGFNMEKPLTEGVHYLSRQEEDRMRRKLIEDEQLRSKIPDMQLKDSDADLVDHIVQLVNDWQALPADEQEPYLNIPAEDANESIPATLNRYQVRLTHQIVRTRFPNLKTQGMGHFVQVTNPNTETKASAKKALEQRREAEISMAVGFRWIMEAMMGGDISKLPHYYVVAGHPPEQTPKDVQAFLNELQKKLRSQSRALVGHNCLTDLINLYRCFIGDLPERVEDFSAKLQELFPVVIDTKYIAGLGNKRYSDTSLRSVEEDLCSVGVPRIHSPSNFTRYMYAANYHEAGFDSWVTAKLGLKIPGKLKREHADIKALVEGSAPSLEQSSGTEKEVVEGDATQKSPADTAIEKQGITSSFVELIRDPVTTVKSLLTGTVEPVQTTSLPQSLAKPLLMPASVMPTNGAVVAAREKVRTTTTSKSELQKLRKISEKANIYDLLEDEPEDNLDGPPEVDESERISELVKEGKLMPRWEDAEFWRLISNKLQANATREGILDLTKR